MPYLTRDWLLTRGNKRLEEAFENQEVLTAKVSTGTGRRLKR